MGYLQHGSQAKSSSQTFSSQCSGEPPEPRQWQAVLFVYCRAVVVRRNQNKGRLCMRLWTTKMKLCTCILGSLQMNCDIMKTAKGALLSRIGLKVSRFQH